MGPGTDQAVGPIEFTSISPINPLNLNTKALKSPLGILMYVSACFN